MSYDLVQVQPLRCINYFQITCVTPDPLDYRHKEDYVKCRRKCTSPFSSCSNTQKHFRLFLQNIFIFFHSCMIHFDSFLSYSKENISIDDVCTFYVKYMWQLIGGNEVMSESWTLVQIWCKLKPVPSSYLRSIRMFIFSSVFPLCHYH